MPAIVVIISIIDASVPTNTLYFYGVNSIIYTNPTVILALSANPFTKRQAYVIYKLDEHNKIIVATN